MVLYSQLDDTTEDPDFNLSDCTDSEDCNTSDEERPTKETHKHSKRKISKKLRNCGKSYTNTAGKNHWSQKTKKPCKCPLKCFDKVYEEDQNALFTSFSDMGSYDSEKRLALPNYRSW